MQTVLKVLVAMVAVAVAWHLGQAAHDGGGAPSKSMMTRSATSQPAPRVKTRGQYRGMAIQLHGGGGVYDRYNRLIPEVADLGANTVLLVVHGWQEHGGSLDLHIDAQKTAHAEDVGKLCDLARVHGLRTILMPVVLLSQPRGSEWRGKIVPANRDWDGWFRRYTQFIVHFAKVAERHKVDVLMVGSELIKTEQYTKRWRRVIQEARQHYRGRLGYSANWDHYQTTKIGFWPELDCVGMTSYYELAEAANPSIDEIDRNWVRIREEIRAFHREVGKPIFFTEVGWCSQEGAAHEGWNYYANQKATEAGQREQLVLYESFIKTWSTEPYVGGIIWWELDLSAGGKDDYNYTPRGKLAEALLRFWFDPKAGGE